MFNVRLALDIFACADKFLGADEESSKRLYGGEIPIMALV
jgi:hypothetical protein